MGDGRKGVGEEDLAVGCDAADGDDGAAVGGRGGVFHVDGGVGGGLKVGERPAGGCGRLTVSSSAYGIAELVFLHSLTSEVGLHAL